MPQVTEFPTFGGERAMPADLAKLCREVPAGGEPFREFRTRLRNARFWDRDRPIVPLRFLGAGGAAVVPSPFMQKLAATTAVPGAPGAIAPEATAAVVAQVGTPLPPALRHLAAASSLPNPRGRGRTVAPSRFAAGFSDELLAETAERISTWWGEVKPN